ncbi:DUF2637 domain-containing protein [Streptomyces sp. NPDC014983]|uniref:DUF2637 domain-containing protein n=1 Tax=Streptomyces sp. NPDC014983 TaxID=3364933 RepID=UPI0037022E97
MERSRNRVQLTRTQRALIAIVVIGAVIIAGIGFVGSYGAVRSLAERKGFGGFALVFPIGVDAGICVLLALDLLLTWLRIPFPLLRQTAWLLTAATIAFNGAAAWPDPLGVGMHAVIPVLFVVAVEAARHAVGRIADITADRHMEGVRWSRWLLSPLPTFLLWRRMILWEIRRYEDVITAEQERLVYQANLRMRFGRAWRWKAPVEHLLPLRIARFGVPLGTAASSRNTEPLPAGSSSTAAAVTSASADRSDVGDKAPAEVTEHAARPAPEAEAGEPQDGARIAEDHEAPLGVGPAHPAQPLPSAQDTEPSAATVDTPQPPGHDGDQVPYLPGPAPEEPASARGEQQGPDEETAVPDEPPPAPGGGGGALSAPHDDHDAVLKGLASNAAAVRYAIEVLNSTHTPALVEWLKERGRPVNRGQAHRIAEAEAGKRRKSPTTMVKTSTG